MTIVRHSDPRAFFAAAATTRSRNAASDAFVRAWVLGLERQPPSLEEEPDYCATFASALAHGLALQSHGGPVVIEDSDPAAAQAFARDLAGRKAALAGVVGTLRACEAFAREWRERTGRGHALRLHLRHHMLTGVIDPPPVSGSVREAIAADRDWIIAAQLAFIRDTNLPDSAERTRSTVPTRLDQGRYRIWDDGAPVAFAGFTDAGEEEARISPVYTPPELRRRGYATALVAALARELLGRGKRRLFLVTDVANPTSNAIYARIGFQPLGDSYHFDLLPGK